MTAFLRRLRKLLLRNQNSPDPGGSLVKIYGDNLNTPDALINRGNKRAANGDMEGALSDFNEAIALNPTKATAFFNRGFLYNTSGQFEAAIHDFTDTIDLLPDYDEAYFQRGNSHRQLGEFQRSIQDYSQAIRLNPYCIKAYYKRADSRADLGDHVGALTDYSQVVMRLPKDANAYCQRGIFLSQSGELAKAVEDFSAAIEHNPRLADAYFHRGYCFAQLGEAEQATQDFSEALLHDPNHQAAYTRAYTLGMLKESSPDAFESSLDNASSLSLDTLTPLEESMPISVESALLTDAEIDAQEPSAAITVPLEPTSVEGLFERANHRIQRGDLGGAITDYTRIIEHDPQNSNAYYQRGRSLGALGDTEAAVEDLNQAIHWARLNSLERLRDFSGELSTTLATLKQDLADFSYTSPFNTKNPAPETPLATLEEVNISPRDSQADSPQQPVDPSPPVSKGCEHHKVDQLELPIETGIDPVETDLITLQPTGLVSPPPPAGGSALFSKSQTLENAIAEQTRAIERNPLDADAFFHRGQNRSLSGDLQGAIADYSRVIRLDPDNGEAYVKRARCRSALGDDAAAQEDLNHAIRHQPIGPAKIPNRPPPRPSQAPPQPQPLPLQSAVEIDDSALDVASVFIRENEILQSSQPPACNHEGNTPGNQFCIYCGDSLDTLSRYSSEVETSLPISMVKPAVSNKKQRLQEAEKLYDQGVQRFSEGDRQGSLQFLSASLKVFLEQREMQRYQQALNLMQDVAHALNDAGDDQVESDDSLLL